MKIHFSLIRPGVFGEGLKNPFQFFGNIISDHFQSEGISSSIQEIKIILAHPGSTKLTSYNNWFSKLPEIRFGNNRTTFAITEKIYPASNKDLSAHLNALFEQTFALIDLIDSKKKKTDIFDTTAWKISLTTLQRKLKIADLAQINLLYEAQEREVIIAHNLENRFERQQSVAEKGKLIQDFRFFYSLPDIDRAYFTPYDQQFRAEILTLLRDRKFRLPQYTHIYIMVADQFENALEHAVRSENWFVYGLAVLEDYKSYAKRPEIEKKRVVFDLIKTGLNDIASIDHLDQEILKEVLSELETTHFH